MLHPWMLAGSERMHGGSGNRDVVDDLRHSRPQRQSGQPFGIKRHDDRVTGLDLHRGTAEPSIALVRDYVAVGAHNVDPAAIRATRGATTQVDVVIPGQPGAEQ